MNRLKIFNHEQFGELKVYVIDGREMFNLNNVAWALGYTKKVNGYEYLRHERISAILKRLDISTFVHDGQKYIDESGLYDFIFEAGTEGARAFRKWVTSEVLPSIRKTGSYSLDVDVRQLSPELQIINNMVKALAKQEIEQNQIKQELNNTKKEIADVRQVFALNPKNWRKEVNDLIVKISQTKNSLDAYRETRNESYKRLEDRARCNLDIRLENKRERMRKAGCSKTAINRVNKMDVIADDPRLIEIYLTIVKEMAIRHQIKPQKEAI